MVGAGGSGMSGLAQILQGLGFTVTGSDLKGGPVVEHLRSIGIPVEVGHSAGHVGQADVVVRSTAVADANPEIVEARKRNIPLVGRGELLAELTRMGETVAVAGSHGKSTTSSMIACVATGGGLDPTVIIGGRVKNFEQAAGARLASAASGRNLYVVESDESDGSFLKLHPALAVVTNIDTDHLDHYGTMDNLRNAFRDFLNLVPFYGVGVVCWDDPNVRRIHGEVRRKTITYGFSDSSDLRAESVTLSGAGSRFSARFKNESYGEFTLSVPGRHHVLNALATIAVCREMDVPAAVIRDSLADFRGVARRFESHGSVGGVRLYDDYGHHPTEIKATLETARIAHPAGRIIVLFQPHRFTRTKLLADEFGGAFELADLLFVTDIYAASEMPINGVTGDTIVQRVARKGHPAVAYVKDWRGGVQEILKQARPGDTILTLGAGDIDQAPLALEEGLKARYGK